MEGRCRCRREGVLYHLTELGGPLCERCFPQSIRRRVEGDIRRYRMIPKGAPVAVAVSGGKDSGALLHILGELRKRLNFSLLAVHVDMGLGDYSAESRATVERLAERVGVELTVGEVSEWEVRVEETGRWPVCAVCGAVRRAILPQVTRRAGAEVVCTGHTLDDQLVYALKDLLSGRAHPPKPVLPATRGFGQKSKPLFYMPEEALAIYSRLTGLPVVARSCPLFDPSTHRLKQVFDVLESLAPMGKPQVLHSLSRFITRPRGPEREEHACPECGVATYFNPCPLCRLRAAQRGGAGVGSPGQP